MTSTFVMIAVSCILAAVAQAASSRDLDKTSRRGERRGFVRVAANDNRAAMARARAEKAKKL